MMMMRPGNSSHGKLLTTADAAAALGVHERTVRRYLASGLLVYRRLPGGHYRIPEQSIWDFWRAAEAVRSRTSQLVGASDQTLGAAPSNRRRGARPQPTMQRRRLSDDSPFTPYDLSTAALAVLRSELS
jgi:excisionase family DNA binding protein